MNRWILISCLFIGTAFAQTYGTDFRKKVLLVKTPAWSVYRILTRGQVRLHFELEKARSEYVPPIPSTQLLTAKRAEWNGRGYVITYWQEGVSTTALRIFDPLAEERKVYEKYSIGDISYEITPKGLNLRIAEGSDDPLAPNAVTEQWEAP